MDVLKSPTLAMKGKLHIGSVVGVSVILCSNCCVEQRQHWEKARIRPSLVRSREGKYSPMNTESHKCPPTPGLQGPHHLEVCS